MEPNLVGIIAILVFVLLMILGVPIAIASVIAGLGIFYVIGGLSATWTAIRLIPFSSVASFDLSSIPLFIIMGNVLFYCGLADGFFTAAERWVGRLPGGLATATTMACAIMGTCTGSSSACSAVMAKIAYPQMKRAGYNPELSTGVISASGTLASIIPPSIMAVIYAVLAEQSVGKILIAGFVPGIITAIVYAIMITTRVKLNPALAPKVEQPATWGERIDSLKYLAPAAIMIGVVVGGIYTGILMPSEAGAIAAAAAFIMVIALRKLNWSRLREILLDTCGLTILVMVVIMGIQFLTKGLSYTRAITAFANLALTFSSPLITLLLMLLVYFILGMFMGATGMMMITVPVFAPVIITLGYDPIWFGIIVIKMCEIALITPPVAVNVFVTQGVVREVPLERAFKGVWPFVVCEAATLALFISFPQIITFLPSKMVT